MSVVSLHPSHTFIALLEMSQVFATVKTARSPEAPKTVFYPPHDSQPSESPSPNIESHFFWLETCGRLWYQLDFTWTRDLWPSTIKLETTMQIYNIYVFRVILNVYFYLIIVKLKINYNNNFFWIILINTIYVKASTALMIQVCAWMFGACDVCKWWSIGFLHFQIV